MYSDKVLRHFQNPSNVGELQDADAVGEVGSPQCGDSMKLYIKVENDVITDISFQTFGCAAAIASSSVATELIKGKTINEALEITNRQIVQELDGLPRVKVHCSVLATDALREAIKNYRDTHAEAKV